MTKVTGIGVRTGVIGLITLLAGVAVPPAWGAKADLAVTQVSGAPAAALTGEAPALKVTVKNVGGKDAKKASLFAQVLGEDGLVVEDKFGKGSVGPTEAGRTRRVTFRPKVPFEAVGEWVLGVCVAPGKATNDCGQTGVIEFTDGSTIGRIDAAHTAGDIDAGEALLYKLYAVSGDEGLPDEYDGGGPVSTGVILADLVSAYSTLPDAEQDALEPFMLQPRYAESAWAPGWSKAPAATAKRAPGDPCGDVTNLSGAWSGIESTHAVIWHRPGIAEAQAKAQALSAEFEAQVWPELTSAFHTVNDAAATPCDPAGDSRVDVYIDSGNALVSGNDGIAPSLPFTNCGPNPSFIVLPGNANRWTLAHEFMHVIQHSYTACERAPAWVEGTATWAGHYVYEDDNYEHRYKGSITTPYFALRDPMLGYDAWPFWYSLENNDDVDAIVRVYEALGSTGFAGALAQGPSDGLEEAWKRYAVERWNQVPIGSPGFPLTQSFKQADGFTAKPGGVPTVDVKLGGLPEKVFQLPTFDGQQRPLSTWFHKVKITDRHVRGLTLDLESPGTIVQGFLKLQNGDWRLEDWSTRDEVDLCRDKPNENVVQMVVATSNATPTDPPLPQATHHLTAKDICEPPTYTGTFSGTSRFFDNSGFDSFDVTTQFNGTLTLAPYDGPGATGREWEMTSGSLNVASYQGSIDPCTITGGGGTFTMPATNADGAISMALSGGRYYVNIPWVIYVPQQSIGITATGPPGEDCEDIDEWPVEGVGQWLTLTPTGVEPDDNGVLSITNLDNDSDPNWEHDNLEFTLTPLP